MRKVNNNLKHGEFVSNDVKQILEFKKADVFDFPILVDFYYRVRDKCEEFLSAIGDAIIQDLYYFTEERLEEIAESYRQRMDSDTIDIFIKLLK